MLAAVVGGSLAVGVVGCSSKEGAKSGGAAGAPAKDSGPAAGGTGTGGTGAGGAPAKSDAGDGAAEAGPLPGGVKTVFLLLMENKTYSEVVKSKYAPYFNGTVTLLIRRRMAAVVR